MMKVGLGALLSFVCAVAIACADEYPNQPIRLITGFPAGSIVDTSARVIGANMSAALGQQVVIENRPGAGSSIAAAQAARSPKDGYTLFIGSSANVIDAAMKPVQTFDFYNDFAPITLITSTPTVLTVAPELGVKNVKELVAYAKANPGKLTFGSAGYGSAAHLALELFKSIAQVDIVHVPYPGSPQALTDILAGRVQGMFFPASTVRSQIATGKLLGLAVTEPKRSAFFPDIPTMAEAGLSGCEAVMWFGIMAPNGTPQAVLDKVSRAASAAVQSDDVIRALNNQLVETHGGSSGEFAKFIEAERARWTGVVEAAGLRK